MSEQAGEPVLIERDAGVAVLTLNRPRRLNALDLELRRTLSSAVAGLTIDPEVRTMVIVGDQRAFAAGADLKLLAELLRRLRNAFAPRPRRSRETSGSVDNPGTAGESNPLFTAGADLRAIPARRAHAGGCNSISSRIRVGDLRHDRDLWW